MFRFEFTTVCSLWTTKLYSFVLYESYIFPLASPPTFLHTCQPMLGEHLWTKTLIIQGPLVNIEEWLTSSHGMSYETWPTKAPWDYIDPYIPTQCYKEPHCMYKKCRSIPALIFQTPTCLLQCHLPCYVGTFCSKHVEVAPLTQYITYWSPSRLE